MFSASDIGINPTVCVSRGGNSSNSVSNIGQAISRLAQSTQNNFQQLAAGVGVLLRFRLDTTLVAGGVAQADIERFVNGGFESVSKGIVHDEEPHGGFWAGVAGDEGWCTARDGQAGHYSILFMGIKSDSGAGDGLNQSWQNLLKNFSGQDTVLFFNNSGSVAPTGAWMRITGQTVIAGVPTYVIGMPNGILHRQYLFNVDGPINDQAVGMGSFLPNSGFVMLDSGTPAVNDEYGVTNGAWGARSNRPGAVITGAATTLNGNSVSAARPYVLQSFIGKADAAITKDNTTGATVSVWTKNFAGDTGLNIDNCCTFTSDVASGAKVSGTWFGGGPIVANITC